MTMAAFRQKPSNSPLSDDRGEPWDRHIRWSDLLVRWNSFTWRLVRFSLGGGPSSIDIPSPKGLYLPNQTQTLSLHIQDCLDRHGMVVIILGRVVSKGIVMPEHVEMQVTGGVVGGKRGSRKGNRRHSIVGIRFSSGRNRHIRLCERPLYILEVVGLFCLSPSASAKSKQSVILRLQR